MRIKTCYVDFYEDLVRTWCWRFAGGEDHGEANGWDDEGFVSGHFGGRM